jgi:hypothetical protein
MTLAKQAILLLLHEKEAGSQQAVDFESVCSRLSKEKNFLKDFTMCDIALAKAILMKINAGFSLQSVIAEYNNIQHGEEIKAGDLHILK